MSLLFPETGGSQKALPFVRSFLCSAGREPKGLSPLSLHPFHARARELVAPCIGSCAPSFITQGGVSLGSPCPFAFSGGSRLLPVLLFCIRARERGSLRREPRSPLANGGGEGSLGINERVPRGSLIPRARRGQYIAAWFFPVDNVFLRSSTKNEAIYSGGGWLVE